MYCVRHRSIPQHPRTLAATSIDWECPVAPVVRNAAAVGAVNANLRKQLRPAAYDKFRFACGGARATIKTARAARPLGLLPPTRMTNYQDPAVVFTSARASACAFAFGPSGR